MSRDDDHTTDVVMGTALFLFLAGGAAFGRSTLTDWKGAVIGAGMALVAFVAALAIWPALLFFGLLIALFRGCS
mgnify:CR=1 FL=1